jgi:hypothetical protein
LAFEATSDPRDDADVSDPPFGLDVFAGLEQLPMGNTLTHECRSVTRNRFVELRSVTSGTSAVVLV